MYQLCDFIVENVDIDVDKTIGLSILSINDFDDLNKTIDIISQNLDIDKTIINVNHELSLISFKYKNRQCEFYERFDTQRDYIVVQMLAVWVFKNHPKKKPN